MRSLRRLLGHSILRGGCALRLTKSKAVAWLFRAQIPWSTKVYGGLYLITSPCNLILKGNNAVGKGTVFGTGIQAKIEVGKNTSINTGCHLVSLYGISIGANCSIAEYVSIRDQEHVFSSDCGVVADKYKTKEIVIGDNVWLGRGTYIGPGVIIGDGSIVAANSVVRGAFPAGVLIAGVPAVVKKQLHTAAHE